MTARMALALVLTLAVQWGAVQARAERGSKGRQQEDRRAVAERFFRAGEQAYNAGQYLVAAQAFEEAYALLPLPAIAFSTAQAYRLQYFIDNEASRLVRAIELYRLYIAEVPRGGRREDATTSLAELEPLRLRLEAQGKLRGLSRHSPGATGTQLMITSQVAGARATIGGEEEEIPLIREVAPGVHEVTVTADGYFPVTQQATAVEGKFIVVEVDLKPRPGLMRVRTEAGAFLSVDGRPAGKTPMARALRVEAGTHFVTISRRGRRPWSKEIEIGRGETLDLRADLDSTGQRRGAYWILGAAGVSAAAAGVSAALAYRADRDLDTLEQKRQRESLTLDEFDAYRRLEVQRDRRMRWTYAFLGVSTTAALTGSILYWFDTPRVAVDSASSGDRGAPGWTAAPVLGAHEAGFAVAGSF